MKTITLKELQQQAKELKIKNWWTMKKADLQEAVNAKEEKETMTTQMQKLGNSVMPKKADKKTVKHFLNDYFTDGIDEEAIEDKSKKSLKHIIKEWMDSTGEETEIPVSKMSHEDMVKEVIDITGDFQVVKEVTETRKATKKESHNLKEVTVADLAEEFNMRQAKIRRIIRGMELTKTGRWTWNNDDEELAEIKEVLNTKQGAKA